MKIIFTLLFISSATIIGFGQDKFQFNSQMKPNSNYQTEVVSIVNTSTKLITKEMIAEEFKNVNGSAEMQLVTLATTSALDKDGNVPFVMNYKTFDIKSFMNGKQLPSQNDKYSDFKKLKIFGIDTKTNREFKKIELNGQEVSGETKMYMNTFFESIKQFNVYPTEVFRIGQTHSAKQNIKLSTQGAEFVINLNSDFTLIKIEDGKAFFNIVILGDMKTPDNQSLKMLIEEYRISGSAIIDLKDNTIAESNFEGPIVMKINSEDFSLEISAKNKYIIKTIKL